MGTPQGAKNEKVNGVLYVDDFSLPTLAGNEQMAFPYSYKIKKRAVRARVVLGGRAGG